MAEDVDDEFAYVGVHGAAEFDRGDDGCEGVIQEHHDRCFAGYVGPGDAHGHADVSLLERGGIVDAVSGCGDDLAEVLESSDDALFVLEPDPGEHHLRMEGELVGELGDAHRLELLAPDHAGTGTGDDADAPGDGFGGYSVVACDHGDPDAGTDGQGSGGQRKGRLEDPVRQMTLHEQAGVGKDVQHRLVPRKGLRGKRRYLVAPGVGDQMLEQQRGDPPVVHVVSYRERDLRYAAPAARSWLAEGDVAGAADHFAVRQREQRHLIRRGVANTSYASSNSSRPK